MYCYLESKEIFDRNAHNYHGTPPNNAVRIIENRKMNAEKKTADQAKKIATYIQQNLIRELREENAALKKMVSL